jgi:hypothetical protein
MARAVFSPGKRMRTKPSAEPLRPDELAQVRALIRAVQVDDYIDAHKAAARLSLSKRTVLDLANAGAFDGEWGVAWKPSHNRLRIPLKGIDAYIKAHPAAAPPTDKPEEAIS